MWISVLLFLAVFIIAIIVGKIFTKIGLPSILGWLIVGMVFGPHAVNLLRSDLLDAEWFQIIGNIMECGVGLMIGSELIWKKLKKSGKQVFVITLTESVGTFVLVTLVFGITFYFMQIPLYLAFIFGAIALATAPAPALSMISSYKTDGPVTRTLMPIAALDDLVSIAVFFTVLSLVSNKLAGDAMPLYLVPVILFAPIIVGVAVGFLAWFALKKETKTWLTNIILIFFITIAAGVIIALNYFVMPLKLLNCMLTGIAFSATVGNLVPEERMNTIMAGFQPFLGVFFVFLILNLGAPLDYKFIMGAGLFTFIYIAARAVGKIGGAFVGAAATKAPKTVKQYLGLTLLPHSGVSLVFTGLAVSAISAVDLPSAELLQGTIAAAAIINEIIAVLLAKFAFKKSGEINQAKIYVPPAEDDT